MQIIFYMNFIILFLFSFLNVLHFFCKLQMNKSGQFENERLHLTEHYKSCNKKIIFQIFLCKKLE